MDGPASSLPNVAIAGTIAKKSSSPFVGWRPRHAVVSGETMVLYRTDAVSSRFEDHTHTHVLRSRGTFDCISRTFCSHPASTLSNVVVGSDEECVYMRVVHEGL